MLDAPDGPILQPLPARQYSWHEGARCYAPSVPDALRLLTVLLLAGCGGGADAPTTRATRMPPRMRPAARGRTAGVRRGAGSAPVTVEDIERWEKGMAAELAAVQEAGAKLGSAKTGEDTLAALMGVQEMTTTPSAPRRPGWVTSATRWYAAICRWQSPT